MVVLWYAVRPPDPSVLFFELPPSHTAGMTRGMPVHIPKYSVSAQQKSLTTLLFAAGSVTKFCERQCWNLPHFSTGMVKRFFNLFSFF